MDRAKLLNEMPIEFIHYMQEHQRLEIEYYRIRNWPIIGFIKQMRNLRQREKLNKAWLKRLKDWGLA